MALQLHTHSTRKRFPFGFVIVVVLLLGVLGVSGYYLYKWYFEGEEPPISIPALATADPRVDESPVSEQQITEHTVPARNPRYISVPSIGITNARVFSVGVTGDNQLASPDNLSDTAWYDQSDTPGSGGVVLINGHNGGITRDGIFAKLGTLKVGDTIALERGDGETFRYEVRENQSMPLKEVNATGMKMMMQSAEDGKEALNLITCDGNWVPRYQQFDRRIMLRAVLVE